MSIQRCWYAHNFKRTKIIKINSEDKLSYPKTARDTVYRKSAQIFKTKEYTLLVKEFIFYCYRFMAHPVYQTIKMNGSFLVLLFISAIYSIPFKAYIKEYIKVVTRKKCANELQKIINTSSALICSEFIGVENCKINKIKKKRDYKHDRYQLDLFQESCLVCDSTTLAVTSDKCEKHLT